MFMFVQIIIKKKLPSDYLSYKVAFLFTFIHCITYHSPSPNRNDLCNKQMKYITTLSYYTYIPIFQPVYFNKTILYT